jgi:hypothetical protein
MFALVRPRMLHDSTGIYEATRRGSNFQKSSDNAGDFLCDSKNLRFAREHRVNGSSLRHVHMREATMDKCLFDSDERKTPSKRPCLSSEKKAN